ncbi:MAG: DNA polymerase III subunit alpha, partial [Pseudomonadota bacterium]
LIHLTSAAFLETEAGDPPHVPFEAVRSHAEGIIALTGGPDGPLDRLLLRGDKAAAKALTETLAETYQDRLYIEVQRHGLSAERRVEPDLVSLAYDLDLPLVATNEPYFADKAMFEAHDALLCIAQGTYVLQEERRRVTEQHYFKSASEMAMLFADLPEAIANTVEIAQRCRFRPKSGRPVLPAYESGTGLNEAAELERQAKEGLEKRLTELDYKVNRDTYEERLAYELSVINGMDFPGYFLIVSDFMKWTRARGIPVGVRGSGATSIVAWALEITSLDPMRFDLVFERFLNPERVSMPDFDIDFCQDRRDEVINYVRDKYGRDRVAQIITFGKLQARAVVRDVGRVLQMPYSKVDLIAKLVPNNPADPMTLEEAIASSDRLQAMASEEETVARLLDIGKKLEGLYRHASTHAAGIVIGNRPLTEILPVYRDPRSDMPVTQFSMKWVEPAGLVKFDFLGLKTLTVIAETEKLAAAKGEEVKADKAGFEDASTYDMLSRGESVGVFQLESSGMRDLLRKMRPDRVEDLIALVALYRPGPMDSIPKYIACKHGREKPDYLHPLLEPILEETFGVMTYQEDVMQIARDLAGYSLGQADLLRRAMGKKIKAEMDEHRGLFITGSAERGVTKDVAERIFDQAAKFAGYGFNKGHAAAYAQVAYQTAFLKANYPAEFIAALMTLDMGQTEKLHVIRQEATRMGIDVDPPDINRSQVTFTVTADRIPYALGAIRNVGSAAMRHVVETREAGGPYRDIWDFAGRIDPRQVNRRAFENLVKAGVFDSLCANRQQLFMATDEVLALASRTSSERRSDQQFLFGGDETEDLERRSLPETPDWPPLERLAKEYEAIGFYLSGHPLDAYARVLGARGVVPYTRLLAGPATTASIDLAGTVIGRSDRKSRKSGKPYAFVQLTDPSAQYEVMVFSDVLSTAGPLLVTGQSVLLEAEVKWEDDEPRLFARSFACLDEAAAKATRALKIVLEDGEPLASLRAHLERFRTDAKGPAAEIVVSLNLKDRSEEVDVVLPWAVPAAGGVVQALRAIPGVLAVDEF